eukprot:Sdes_comp9010_c0_seq1m431
MRIFRFEKQLLQKSSQHDQLFKCYEALQKAFEKMETMVREKNDQCSGLKTLNDQLRKELEGIMCTKMESIKRSEEMKKEIFSYHKERNELSLRIFQTEFERDEMRRKIKLFEKETKEKMKLFKAQVNQKDFELRTIQGELAANSQENILMQGKIKELESKLSYLENQMQSKTRILEIVCSEKDALNRAFQEKPTDFEVELYRKEAETFRYQRDRFKQKVDDLEKEKRKIQVDSFCFQSFESQPKSMKLKF